MLLSPTRSNVQVTDVCTVTPVGNTDEHQQNSPISSQQLLNRTETRPIAVTELKQQGSSRLTVLENNKFNCANNFLNIVDCSRELIVRHSIINSVSAQTDVEQRAHDKIVPHITSKSTFGHKKSEAVPSDSLVMVPELKYTETVICNNVTQFNFLKKVVSQNLTTKNVQPFEGSLQFDFLKTSVPKTGIDHSLLSCWVGSYGPDEYEHVQPGLVYTDTSIPGPGMPLELFEQIPRGCRCKLNSQINSSSNQSENSTNLLSPAPNKHQMQPKHSTGSADFDCTLIPCYIASSDAESSCQCMTRTRARYCDGLLTEACQSYPLYECNDDCECDTDGRCTNRLVQRGPWKHLEIVAVKGKVTNRKTGESFGVQSELPSKGFGVITKLFIPSGAFVCEYAGELLGKDAARARFTAQEKTNTTNYIMVLREFYSSRNPRDNVNTLSTSKLCPDFATSEPLQITIIDPTCIGNIGRYLNHSCEPNLQVLPVRINSVVPVAAMFTLRDIMPGEELVYDYGSADILNQKNEVFRCNVNNESSDAHVTVERKTTTSLDCKRKLCDTDEFIHNKQKLINPAKSIGPSVSLSEETVLTIATHRMHCRQRCFCGSQSCRGFLPAERDLF